MGIKLSKAEIFAYAADSLPEHLPTKANETGIMDSRLMIGGYYYNVSYLRNTSTGKWFVAAITNEDGTPIN